LIIPDAWRAGLAVLALRMASRRCFLTTIAVLALVILRVAMAAASGSSARAAADALLIDTDTNVACESISGEAIGPWTLAHHRKAMRGFARLQLCSLLEAS
jgi:hypothetical protein